MKSKLLIGALLIAAAPLALADESGVKTMEPGGWDFAVSHPADPCERGEQPPQHGGYVNQRVIGPDGAVYIKSAFIYMKCHKGKTVGVRVPLN